MKKKNYLKERPKCDQCKKKKRKHSGGIFLWKTWLKMMDEYCCK